MSPLVSNMTASTSVLFMTPAIRSFARRSASVTRDVFRFLCKMRSPAISSRGSLFTSLSTCLLRTRDFEITYCMRYSTASPNAPASKEGSLLRSVDATTVPKATVMAKSKLDIFEKLRNPTSRVKTIRAT